jgi:hypothetical protein
MAQKTGLVAITFAVEKICRVLAVYDTKARIALDAAVADGLITSGQAVTAKAFLDSAGVACTIFRLATGY